LRHFFLLLKKKGTLSLSLSLSLQRVVVVASRAIIRAKGGVSAVWLLLSYTRRGRRNAQKKREIGEYEELRQKKV
jgi:hypothetical protein